VRAAYLAAIREAHPDVNPGLDATRASAAINGAYEALSQARALSRLQRRAVAPGRAASHMGRASVPAVPAPVDRPATQLQLAARVAGRGTPARSVLVQLSGGTDEDVSCQPAHSAVTLGAACGGCWRAHGCRRSRHSRERLPTTGACGPGSAPGVERVRPAQGGVHSAGWGAGNEPADVFDVPETEVSPNVRACMS